MSYWKIDPHHSDVTFKVQHLLVAAVTGYFEKFDATIEASQEDFSDAVFRFEAETNSINSGNEKRDEHLRSVDFFDAASFPRMWFVSKAVRVVSDFELQIVGDLTLRGVNREIVLDAYYNGSVGGIAGGMVAGFEIRTKLRRFDFGLQWNGLTGDGNVLAGNEVKIEILGEFIKAQGASTDHLPSRRTGAMGIPQ